MKFKIEDNNNNNNVFTPKLLSGINPYILLLGFRSLALSTQQPNGHMTKIYGSHQTKYSERYPHIGSHKPAPPWPPHGLATMPNPIGPSHALSTPLYATLISHRPKHKQL